MKAKLWLKCACGKNEMVRCEEDDSTKAVAQQHGWEVRAGQWVCPECFSQSETNAGRVVEVLGNGLVKVKFG